MPHNPARWRAIEQGIDDLSGPERFPAKGAWHWRCALRLCKPSPREYASQSNALGWRHPIAEIIQRVTKIPTYLDNDAHSVATGQKLFGKARESRNFSIIMLGKKIGEGHYINGRLHRGHTGAAGEIGHCTVVPGGPPCDCGKRGCLGSCATSSAC